MARCECKVGPGKFEGEPAATFLAWEVAGNGCADEDIGRYSFLRFPLQPDDETKALAKAYGYCDACIADVGNGDVYGVALWESEQGFVYCEWLNDEKEWNKATATAEAAEECEEADEYD